MTGIDQLVDLANARRSLPDAETRKAIRTAAHVSQREVAAALGVSAETVSRWESTEHLPRGARVIRYLEVLQALDTLAHGRE